MRVAFITAPHGMQTRSSDKNSARSVCPSVRLSVKRVICDKMEERSVQIFIPYKRSFSLVFWEEDEWLVGWRPLPEILGQLAPLERNHPVARSLCDSWASCKHDCSNTTAVKCYINRERSVRVWIIGEILLRCRPRTAVCDETVKADETVNTANNTLDAD